MDKNYSVDETMLESVQDDAAQASAEADALSEAIGAISEPERNQQEESKAAPQQEESKALKGRMKSYEERGYKRGVREMESKWADEKRGYEERLARYEKLELEAEAKRLAKEKNIPEDIALEYLSLKKGQPVDAPATQPRTESGRFAKRTSDPEAPQNDAQARAAALMAQAEAFEKSSRGEVGKDAILEAFETDDAVRAKVASGEWDFTDVGLYLAENASSKPPRAVRSPNGGTLKTSGFATMSDEDFAKFNDRVAKGAVFDTRR